MFYEQYLLISDRILVAHSATGKIVYHQASKTHWSSDTIRFVDSDPVTLENARLYKVRWDDPDQVP